jgi:hypothetical protein
VNLHVLRLTKGSFLVALKRNRPINRQGVSIRSEGGPLSDFN